MSSFKFTKYHGTGNDFILIDNRNQDIHLDQEEISELCHRRYGIGADGLMFLQLSDEHDFEMIYFNADGLEGSMCGNGGRCIAAFAVHLGIIKDSATFKAIDGLHSVSILKSEDKKCMVEISLKDTDNIQALEKGVFTLDTGSPHYVEFVDDLEAIDTYQLGKTIRWDERFQPDGINVNFVEKKGSGLKVVTFERGVENITLSCGTGVTAAALASSAVKKEGHYTWEVTTRGGELSVSFIKQNNHFTDIWLSGPAEKVFSGTINRS